MNLVDIVKPSQPDLIFVAGVKAVRHHEIRSTKYSIGSVPINNKHVHMFTRYCRKNVKQF